MSTECLTVKATRQENITFLPGDTVAGSVLSGRCPSNPKNVVLVCGNHGGTCGVRFTYLGSAVARAHANGETVYCDGCTDHRVAEEVRERQHKVAMTVRTSLTAKQVVLRAAIELAGPKLRATFTYVDVVLAAWRLDHKRFGLPGHETEHPDSNRVKMELCSRRDGTLMDLYLERPRPNVYRFSPAGIALLERERHRAAYQQAQTGGGV